MNTKKIRRPGHSLKARLAATALAVGLVASGGVAAATSASAAVGNCPVGYACAWGDTAHQTAGNGAALISFFQCQKDFAWVNYAGTSINAGATASSVANRGQHQNVTFYMGAGYTGSSFTLAPGEFDSSLANTVGQAPGGFDNSIRSGKFASASTSCV